jgi:tetratricopeptide (TPR) repeat protein
MREYVKFNSPFTLILFTLLPLVGGRMSYQKARQNVIQVSTLLADRTKKTEPREVDGRTARSEYAIEHPLTGSRKMSPNQNRAIDQFYESTRCHQDGNEQRALLLYQEAIRSDPSLHQNAREVLQKMVHECDTIDAGAIHYWIGIHSEYLLDLKQAAIAYEDALNSFVQIGYKKRGSRACNNLGSVKMQMRDDSAMDSFDKAIELDPNNGMAHISIGITYYRISQRGDPIFEIAMDSFANAIVADSLAYTPLVTSRLRSIGYTWKEDLEDVLQRVDKKLLSINTGPDLSLKKHVTPKSSQENGVGFDINQPDKKSDKVKTYKDKEHGYEIDIPIEWIINKEIAPVLAQDLFELVYGWTPNVDVAFTNGPDEILNIVTEIMEPEPTTNVTERFFKVYSQKMNFTNCEYGRIEVCNKVHTWVRYKMNNKVWSKKYMIVLNGKGYAITASCIDKEKFSQREKVWDAITTSFRFKE